MKTPDIFNIGDNFESIVNSCNYESLNSLNQDVEAVKKWMETQPHLPEIMDEKRIQNFLLLNRGSIQTTKEKIDNYYSFRTSLPEIYNQINPKLPYFERVLNACYFVPLPELTQEMYRVFLWKTRDRSLVENFDPVWGVRYLVNLQEVRILEDAVFGDVFVFDGSDVPLSAILNVTPSILYKALVVIYKKIFSNRVKAIYIVNAPTFVDKLLFLLKAVLKPKVYDRIHFCTSDVLLEKVGKNVLPQDYGGAGKSLQDIQRALREKFAFYGSHFDKLDTMKVDEKFRPPKLRNDDLLGFYGNFKKLEID